MSYYGLVVIFILCLFGGWWMTFMGLPGNWLIVVMTLIFSYVIPETSGHDLSWKIIVFLALLAACGEVIETLGSAAGMKKGGSKKGAIAAIIGSLVGAFIGAGLGFPIPVIGPLVGVILFSSLGAVVGAILVEFDEGTSRAKTIEIGKAVFFGRLLGTVAKIAIGSAMVFIAGAAAILS